jgi:hypothetical protein
VLGSTAIFFVTTFLTTPDSSRVAAVYPMMIFGMLTYFSYKAGSSWIQITEDGKEVVIIPCWYSRRLLGERGKTATIAPGSELFFVRRYAYGVPDGYFISVRTPGGTEQIMWNSQMEIFASRRRWNRIADEIDRRYGLRSRLITQIISSQGRQEAEWSQKSHRVRWTPAHLIFTAPAFSPFFGIAVGMLTRNPRTIAATGVLIWVIDAIVYWYIFRTMKPAEGRNLTTTLFVWTVQFVPFYTAMVFLTGIIMRNYSTH